MKNRAIFKFVPFIILVVLPTVLISIWFREGYMFGGGDVGLPTFNPKVILKLISNIWWEQSAPGFPRPQGISGIPFYSFFSIVQIFAKSPVNIQMVEFWFYLTLMGTGMYLVAKDVFGEGKRVFAFAGAIYYMINPFMMIQIWHRFVHTGMLFAALLPFIFLFWKRWIDTGFRKYLLFFALLNTLGSIIFSTLGYTIVLWILLGFYLIFTVFIPIKDLTSAVTYFKRFFIGILIWILISLWWVIPVLTAGNNIFRQQHSISNNLSTLQDLAKQTIIPYLVQGINPFYLFKELDWGNIYNLWFIQMLPLLLVGIGLSGLFRGFAGRKYTFWSMLFILALFFSKGVADPFGSLFTFLFEHSFILGVLRNPFEKMGILLPFSFSILIPLGIIFLNEVGSKTKLSKLIQILLLMIFTANIFIWNWPFWTGKLFGSADNPQEVEIPSYYQEADSWIMQQGKSGRILHLPLNATEAVTYQWNRGYRGVEPNHVLFESNPSLAQGFNLEPMDSMLRTWQELLRSPDMFDTEKLQELFNWFNVSFIVLHLDAVSTGKDAPQYIRTALDKLPFVKYRETYGKLVIYEVEDGNNSPVFLANLADYLYSGENNQYWPWILKDNSRILISSNDKNKVEEIKSLLDSIIISPKQTYIIKDQPAVFGESILEDLPPVRFLPGNFLYYFIRIKELLEINSLNGVNRIVKQVNVSSKRLVEAIKMKKIDPKFNINSLIYDYNQNLNTVIVSFNNGFVVERDFLSKAFAYHLLILKEIQHYPLVESEKTLISKTENTLKEDLVLSGLNSLYQVEKDDNNEKRLFTFDVPENNDYRIILGYLKDSFNDQAIDIQINGNKINLQKSITNRFDKGYNEISYSIGSLPVELSGWSKSSAGQLKELKNEIELSSSRNDPIFIETQIKNFVPDETYEVNFEYWVQNGKGPWIQILQDDDQIVKGERKMEVNTFFSEDLYYRYWRKGKITFKPRSAATEVKLRILLEPWDDCKEIQSNKVWCDLSKSKQNFQKSSTVVLRNIKTQRLIEPVIFLQTASASASPSPYKKIITTRVSPHEIKGTFSLEKTAFLIFSETFDSNWKLKLKLNNDNLKQKTQFLTNLFGNGWYIDKPGDYEFSIVYSPQNYVFIGCILSLVVYAALIIAVIKKYD